MLANTQEVLTQTSEKDSFEMVKFKQRPKGLEELSYVYVATTGVEWGWESFIWRNTCEGRLEERAWCVPRAHRRPGWLNREGRGKVVRAGAGGLWVNTPFSQHFQLQMTKALGLLKDADTFVPPSPSFFLCSLPSSFPHPHF